ncbi:nuclear transport factor 2 [Ceratobasidium sp. AG-Ba]|nr:nuclear transport factor 2 [Ceratobasidium sp. AG-Ba]
MSDPAAITEQFAGFYYGEWQKPKGQRSGLANLYRDSSTVTYEGQTHTGVGPIMAKYESLPFEKLQYKLETKDHQLTNGGMLILATGQLLASH